MIVRPTLIMLILSGWLATSLVSVAAVAEITHTWADASNLEGWSHTAPSSADLRVEDGQLELVYHAQSMPRFVTDSVTRPIAENILLSSMAFTFEVGAVSPSRIRVLLHVKDGGVWTCLLGVPQAGETKQYTIPITFEAGWRKTPTSTADDFARDLRSIDWLGVETVRHASTGVQLYAMDTFHIEGVQYTGDADMDGIADTWETANGLNFANHTDAALDSDGDGMSNYAEFRAGTNPHLSSSRFEARVARIAGETGAPFQLRWSSVSNRWYTIWRSTDLAEGFEALVTGVPAAPPVNVYQDATATNSPGYFYRVEVEPEF
jgi:hypothetical protein